MLLKVDDAAVLKVLKRLVDDALVDAARVMHHRAEVCPVEQNPVRVTNGDIVRCATSLFPLAEQKLAGPDFMRNYFGSDARARG